MSDNEGKISEKEKLEIDKLKNEIAFQKNPLRNPANWAPFATLVGTCFALIYGICSGWFGTENSLLQLRKEKLEKQINKFVDDSTRLYKTNDSLVKKVEKSNQNLRNASDSLNEKRNQVSNLSQENKTLIEKNRILNQTVLSLSDKKRLDLINENEITRIKALNNLLQHRYDSIQAEYYKLVIKQTRQPNNNIEKKDWEDKLERGAMKNH